MTIETFMANFGHLADAPNGVKKLRELILQLAVQGKLVPQDEKEESASVLLDRIKAEKEQLVKEGKIKKQKPFPAIADEEKPFNFPKGWEFVRFGDITNRIGSGSTPRGGRNAYVSSGFPFLRSQNIWNHGLELRDVAYIAEETHKKMSNTVVFPGDILLNITGASLGRCTIFPDEIGEANVSQHVTIIRPTMDSTKAYLHLCVLSPYTQALVWGRQVGMAREGLSKKVLELFEIPIPPLKEQKRIVAKVDQLMTLCNELETRQQKQQQGRVRLNNAALDALLTASEPDKFADHWQRICNNFDLLYDHPETITKLRAAILQLAVQGKLVPQDPNDEPASVLLERVKAEKKRLVKEGKIKKQKKLPAIKDEEKPFDLPVGWDWSRVWYVAEMITSGSRGWAKYYSDRGPIFVTMGNLSRGHYKLRMKTIRYVNPPKTGEGSRTKLIENDLLISITGDVGNLGLIPKDFGEAYINQHTCLLRFMPDCQNRFFPELMRSPLAKLQYDAPQRGIKNSFRLGDVGEMIIPIPPLQEQKRIVTKVDELMALCNELEAKLNQSQQHSAKLLEATVQQLLVA